MKRLIASLIALSMLLTVAGCGGGSQPQPAQQPESPALIDHTQTNNQSSPGTATPAAPAEPPAASGPKYGGLVRMITTAETAYPFGLPWNSAANFSTQVIVPFGECLVLEATNGDIFPFLATEWQTDMEKEELVLKLRDDIYFSDGSKFNADVVEWNFVKSKEARALNPAIDSVVKRGEYEVAVIMAGGYTNMILNLLASHSFAICSKENFDKNGEYFAGENPVGTGPFIMSDKQPGSKVTYDRNEKYWQPGKPYLDNFEFAAITDGMTQNASMLSKGNDRVDVLNNPPSPEQLKVLDADPDLTVWAFPSGTNCIWVSSMNEDSPFAKQEVREAVSYAIDRELVSDALGYGYQKAATQFIPAGYYGHYPDNRDLFGFDVGKSKELLAAAGYPDGFTTTWHASASANLDIIQALIDMLEVIGIKCELELSEPARIVELRSVTGWEGIIYQGFPNLASLPSTFRLSFDVNLNYNKSAWRPPGYTDAFDMLRMTPTFDQGAAEAVHNLLADYMCFIPIMETVNSYVVRNSIRDAEYGYWAVGTQWLVADMWLDE
ncbi:MAG: ABC transporter substrate-binding protein [Clostridiales bacterium]|nr:ABC transporter substrate-binding protein [Clostridiales bacterium]